MICLTLINSKIWGQKEAFFFYSIFLTFQMSWKTPQSIGVGVVLITAPALKPYTPVLSIIDCSLNCSFILDIIVIHHAVQPLQKGYCQVYSYLWLTIEFIMSHFSLCHNPKMKYTQDSNFSLHKWNQYQFSNFVPNGVHKILPTCLPSIPAIYYVLDWWIFSVFLSGMTCQRVSVRSFH